MTTRAASRTTCVLDVETAPRVAVGEGVRDGRAAADRLSNHALVCTTLLIERTFSDSQPPTVELVTFDDRDGEPALIDAIERTLPNAGPTATLVTFNGIGHDLIALRSRAMANWRFACPNLKAWIDSDRHIDLMLALSADGRSKWPSLAAACGALAVPAKTLPPSSRRTASSVLLTNQCDVVATYLLHLHLKSFDEGSPLSLARGWIALADELGRGGAPSHLAPYADHPFVSAAERIVAKLGMRPRRPVRAAARAGTMEEAIR